MKGWMFWRARFWGIEVRKLPPANETPSTSKKAFSCPRCGAFADQFWYNMRAKRLQSDDKSSDLPSIATRTWVEQIKEQQNKEVDQSKKVPRKILDIWEHQASGDIYLLGELESIYCERVENLHLSLCRSCKAVTLWLHDRVIYPNYKFEIEPNSDLSPEIQQDFNEAREVLAVSARAAAALLRLCVQKLCVQLGLPGNNLNDDIAALVVRGISPKVQKSLDIVRVVGNESVHPGTIDLRDNRETAEALFKLVNLIAQEMITSARELNSLYDSLPSDKKAAIERRDQKGLTDDQNPKPSVKSEDQ